MKEFLKSLVLVVAPAVAPILVQHFLKGKEPEPKEKSNKSSEETEKINGETDVKCASRNL